MQDKLTMRELPVEASNPCRVPLNMTQKTVARRMQQGARDIPQFSVSMELNADKLAAWRSRINSAIENQERRISVTALLIWLTARSLLKHPCLNAEFDRDAMIKHDTVNMAVAIDTPEGLTAPVIRHAETLSVCETAEALRDLVARAAGKRLSLSDFTNATFTISNLGMFGVSRFTPLINPPQAAILGVGGPRMTVQADGDGNLVPARMMELTVTADHRILDGAKVARFLQTLQASVERAESWAEVGAAHESRPATNKHCDTPMLAGGQSCLRKP
jgi:pyruvate dehydrogenase E2 component (dihydrolipoamide acetyltransferase)